MEHFDYAHEKLNSDEVTLMVEGWIKLSAGEEVGREEPTFEQSEWLRRNKQ